MIATLRAANGRTVSSDRALLDLIELLDLGLAPGLLQAPQLGELWGITQPQVSRRLAALHRFTPWQIQGWQGGRQGYWIGPPVGPMPEPVPAPDPAARWEALRLRLQEGVA